MYAITFPRDESLFGRSSCESRFHYCLFLYAAPDPDVPLDLMLAIHTIYEQASYDMRIDYRQPPPKPDFSEEEQLWIRQVASELV